MSGKVRQVQRFEKWVCKVPTAVNMKVTVLWDVSQTIIILNRCVQVNGKVAFVLS
jgi:hypothetical protein